MTSPLHPWKTDEQDELIELGNNWWVLARFGAPVSWLRPERQRMGITQVHTQSETVCCEGAL